MRRFRILKAEKTADSLPANHAHVYPPERIGLPGQAERPAKGADVWGDAHESKD